MRRCIHTTGVGVLNRGRGKFLAFGIAYQSKQSNRDARYLCAIVGVSVTVCFSFRIIVECLGIHIDFNAWLPIV